MGEKANAESIDRWSGKSFMFCDLLFWDFAGYVADYLENYCRESVI